MLIATDKNCVELVEIIVDCIQQKTLIQKELNMNKITKTIIFLSLIFLIASKASAVSHSLSISNAYISPNSTAVKHSFCKKGESANLGINILYSDSNNSTAKKITCKWKLEAEIIKKNGTKKYTTLLKGKFNKKNVLPNSLLEFSENIKEKLNKKLLKNKFANSFENDKLSAKLIIDLKGKIIGEKKFTKSEVYDVTIYNSLPGDIPTFAGIMFAYATDNNKIELLWPEAANSNVVANSITYHIYKSSVSGTSTIYEAANLVKSVYDKTESEITGLSANQKYYFLVVAENAFGNKNENHKLVPATTMSSELSIKKQLNDITGLVASKTAFQSNLKGNKRATSTITLNGDYSSAYSVNDIIAANNIPPSKIISISTSGGQTIFTVEESSLEACIQSGSLIDFTVLKNPDELPEQVYSSVNLGPALNAKRKMLSNQGIRYYEHPEGKFLVWGEKADPNVTFYQKNAKGHSVSGADFDYGVTFDQSLNFTPTLEKNIEYGFMDVDSIRVVVGGEFNLKGTLNANVSGSVDFSKEINLIKYNMVLAYGIGPIPVYQDITIELNAKLDFEAHAEINFEAVVEMIKTLKFGLEWDENNGWQPVTEDGFTREVTVTLTDEAGATAALTVYPKITTAFYKTGEIGISIYPTLEIAALADLIPYPCLTKFDVSFYANLQLHAALKCLGFSLVEWNSENISILDPITLFSLPEISFTTAPTSGNVNNNLLYQIQVVDGVNNSVSSDNINWEIYPASNYASISPQSGSKSAYFTASQDGDYNIYASAYGDGFLYSLGKKYSSTSVNIGSDPTYSISGTVSGDTQSGVTMTLSGDASTTTTTGSGGDYSFTGLVNGNYTVTPSEIGYIFTQSSENVTISGADVNNVNFIAKNNDGNISFDDTLSAWEIKSGSWTASNNILTGFFTHEFALGTQGTILLKDEYQPQTTDWRIGVDFAYIKYPNRSYYYSHAVFSLWHDSQNKHTVSMGDGGANWSGSPQTAIKVNRQSYQPWTTILSENVQINWDPQEWNRAEIEKNANQYTVYLNGTQITQFEDDSLAGAKLGFHIYGICKLRNFSLTQ